MSDARACTVVRDRTERIGGALVRHGPVSDRAYLVKPSPDPAADVAVLERLASEHGYGKLFAKITADAFEQFRSADFAVEARVPLADRDGELLFCSRFVDSARAHGADRSHLEQVLAECAVANTHAQVDDTSVPPPTASLQAGVNLADTSDIDDIARLYAGVFESYPFDIDDPRFIAEAMREGTVFAVMREGERLAAAASAEIDVSTASCEMTDFATVPDQRGRGLASSLLCALEAESAARGCATAYTIARASSASMNVVFARRGYGFGGTLVNNTGICGRVESMNVWYRSLHPGDRG